MKYLCMIFVDENNLDAMPAAERQALTHASLDYDDVLRTGGHLLANQALQPARAARTLRPGSGTVMITDGPFAETREQIGGFILIEAEDLEEATRLASKIPALSLGAVEVRPILELRRP